MSDTIFGKIRLVTLGNIHALLNKVIDETSIPAVEQMLRDLRNSAIGLQQDADEAEGEKRQLRKDYDRARGEQKANEEAAEVILNDGNPDNDHLATAFATKSVTAQNNADAFKESLVDAEKLDAQLDDTVGRLTAKILSLEGKLNRARIKDSSAKRKEKAASALQDSTGHLGGEDGSVDKLLHKIDLKDEVASAKFERASSQAGAAVKDDDTTLAATALLEKLKAKKASAAK